MATSKKFPAGTWVVTVDDPDGVAKSWEEEYNIMVGVPYQCEAPNERNYRDHENTKSVWVWLPTARSDDGQQIGLAEKYFRKVDMEHPPMPEPDFDLNEIHAMTKEYSKLTKNKSRA